MIFLKKKKPKPVPNCLDCRYRILNKRYNCYYCTVENNPGIHMAYDDNMKRRVWCSAFAKKK